MSTARPRRYRGITSEERRADRRERLLDAGLQLFGDVGGYARTTIREVCATAGLNQRYFYESFAGREEVLVAVYDRIVSELARTVLVASEAASLEAKVSAGLAAWWEVLSTDPHKAHIICGEGMDVSRRMVRRHRDARGMITRFMVAQLQAVRGYPGGWTEDELERHAQWLVAGTMDLMLQWLHGDTDRSVPELVQECTERFLLVSQHLLEDAPAEHRAPVASRPGSKARPAATGPAPARARNGGVRRPRAKRGAGSSTGESR